MRYTGSPGLVKQVTNIPLKTLQIATCRFDMSRMGASVGWRSGKEDMNAKSGRTWTQKESGKEEK